MLQLIYGNDRTNYRVIAKSPELTQSQENALKQYKIYEIVRDYEKYTSRAAYPTNLVYCFRNLGGLLKAEQVILCLNGQMENIDTPSTYFQSMVWPVEDDFFRERFSDLFCVVFPRSTDFPAYDGRELNRELPELAPCPEIQAGAVDQETLRAALLHFHENEAESEATHWVPDVEGDAYNWRVKELLRAFYSCLPWQVRKACGFCTYCGESRNWGNEIRIRVADRSKLTGKKSWFDWKNPQKREYKDDTAEYVRFLLDGEDGEKKAFLAELENLFRNEAVPAGRAMDYYCMTRIWPSQPVQTVFPKWKRYLIKNQYEKGILFGFLLGQMQERLPVEEFMDILMGELEKTDLVYSEIPEQGGGIENTFTLAELLPWIELDGKQVAEWEQGRILDRAELEGVSPETVRDREIRKIETSESWGEKRKELDEFILETLDFSRTLKEGTGETEEKRGPDPAAVLGWSADILEKMCAQAEGSVLSDEDYGDCLALLGSGRGYLSQELEERIRRQWNDANDRYHSGEEKRKVKILNRRDVLLYYQLRYSQKEYDRFLQKKKQKEIIYTVEFADKKAFGFPWEILETLVEFVLLGEKKEQTLHFLQVNPASLLNSLLSSGLFGQIHFESLLLGDLEEEKVKSILDYYWQSGTLPDGWEEMLKQIEPRYPELAEQFFEACQKARKEEKKAKQRRFFEIPWKK